MAETPKIALKDVTLREGAQAAPVSFTLDEKAEIAVALTEIGVEIVQIAFAGREDDTVARIRAVCPTTTLEVIAPSWDPGTPAALASSSEAGADMCGLVVRSTDEALANLGISPDEARERLGNAVAEAKKIGYKTVRLALSYGSEADPSVHDALCTAGLDAGATVITYADTPGTATPEKVRQGIGEIAQAFPQAIINSHMHNDFGLAVANTIAAVNAGAAIADVTVNGLGDRAGNSPLDETAMALEVLYGRHTGIELSKLADLAELVARLSGQPVPRMKPIVGEDCFSHKFDLKVAALASGGATFEPFPPGMVGRTRTIKLGWGSGPAAVKAIAAKLDLEVADEAVDDLVTAVNQLALKKKDCVTDAEFRTLAEA